MFEDSTKDNLKSAHARARGYIIKSETEIILDVFATAPTQKQLFISETVAALPKSLERKLGEDQGRGFKSRSACLLSDVHLTSKSVLKESDVQGSLIHHVM